MNSERFLNFSMLQDFLFGPVLATLTIFFKYCHLCAETAINCYKLIQSHRLTKLSQAQWRRPWKWFLKSLYVIVRRNYLFQTLGVGKHCNSNCRIRQWRTITFSCQFVTLFRKQEWKQNRPERFIVVWNHRKYFCVSLQQIMFIISMINIFLRHAGPLVPFVLITDKTIYMSF